MSRRRRAVVGAALLGVALVVAGARVTTRASSAGVALGAPWAFGDFRNLIYYPVQYFFEGGNPYNGRTYAVRYPEQERFPPFLPATLLIHAPIGLLPLGVAQFGYAVVIIAFTGVLVWMGFRGTGDRARHADGGSVAAATGLTLLSRPGQWNLLLGQLTLEVALLSHLALRYARRVPWVGGLALGVSTFKPTFGFPLAILLLARGDRRAVVVGAACAVALNLPVTMILAHTEGGFRSLVASSVANEQAWMGEGLTGNRLSGRDEFNTNSVHRLDLVALAGRFVPEELAGPAMELVITFIVLGFAGLLVHRVANRAPDHTAQVANPIICLAILLSVYHLVYDLLLLVPFVIALARRDVPTMLQRGTPRLLLLASFAALAANYVSTQAVVARLGQAGDMWVLLSSINPLLLVVVFSVYAFIALEATRAARTSPVRV
jgi:hypothetical protein